VESVQVSLEHALTDVRLKEVNGVTLTQLRQIIKDGGFNAGAAKIEAIGTLSIRDDGVYLRVSGTIEEFRLIAEPSHPEILAEAREAAGKDARRSYVVAGHVDAGHDLQVQSVGPYLLRSRN
jgi:hypothetical protein